MPETAVPTIRFANFLSPLLHETYAYIAHYVGRRVGRPTVLHTGETLEEFACGRADVGFLCGLLYVQMMDRPDHPLELLAAPVLHGEQYGGQPVYFSAVVVRQESVYRTFDDLAGSVWAYNERASHSGCNLVCHSLLERGKPPDYFGKTIKSGSHLASLQMVMDGEADATALDSQVLDVLLKQDIALGERVRVIALLGPSSIPPLVVASRIGAALKQQMRDALLTMHHDAQAARELERGGIARFVPVVDKGYDDIRAMFQRVQASEFPFV